jgi:hypothetical protein
MDLDRRTFLILPAAAALTAASPTPVAALPQATSGAVMGARRIPIRRVGQLNMTEHDPVALDVEAWADYWKSLQVDVVLVSVTGILAFYQTTVPFHRKGKYLGTRDFFGECFSAAKQRGLKVIARMSPDLNWEDATRAHPEWFQKDAAGKIVVHSEDARLFRTCMFTGYMTDYMPAIMKEITAQYAVDGLYTNAWPPLGALPRCACDVCRTLPPHGTLAHWEAFNRRTEELWRLYDGIAKAKAPSLFYFGNLGGGVRSSADLVTLGELADWFQCDNQGRGGDDTPIWGCAMQGRVCHAVQPGKMATNVTGAWSTGAPRWRNVHKAIPEARMWMNETVASGMVPYHHIIGGETGLGEDRRALEPAHQFFTWHARHEAHFRNRRSIASIAVVMGQRGQLFHTPPAGTTMPQYLNGLYWALLEGRFLFDFVHEATLSAEALATYAAVLLPNVAWLSDAQCAALRAYAASGGSLLGTFQTSLFNERGTARTDYGLADVFGIRKAGEVIGTTGNGYMGRIEGRHPILEGFGQTPLIPGAEYRIPLAPVAGSALTVVPGYVAYPPELSYPEPAQTTEPAMVVREQGQSRTVFFPGDVDRTAWRSGHPDLSRLLRNAIRWVAGATPPATVEGDGVVELFAWETEAGLALHLLNYTNPAMHKGSIREFYPIGPQRVRMALPAGFTPKQVSLLQAGADVPFQVANGTVSFTIPKVVDYEVAAIV